MRVAQVFDVAGVAPALSAALSDAGHEVRQFGARQAGASWPAWLKPLAIPARLIEAERVASALGTGGWQPDVVHIHWLANAMIGDNLRSHNIADWLVHCHGSDVRSRSAWRRGLLRMAPAVVYSTPDLAGIRSDAVYIPTPIPQLSVKAEPRWDVLVSARAAREKGSARTFAALRELRGLRMAAIDGPAFERGPWERLAPVPKAAFHRLLASTRVVIGQFEIGALGIADLEAMALGRPLVTWIRPELYGEDPPPVAIARDPAEIADAVRRLLEAPEPGGPDWVRRHHAPALVVERLESVYRALLDH